MNFLLKVCMKSSFSEGIFQQAMFGNPEKNNFYGQFRSPGEHESYLWANLLFYVYICAPNTTSIHFIYDL